MKILTIEEFNKIYIDYRIEKGKNIHLSKVKGFTLVKNVHKYKEYISYNPLGIPSIKKEIIHTRQVPDIKSFNKAIVAWLKIFTDPIKAEVTNTKGYMIDGRWRKNPNRGQADITAQYHDFELCIETKQKHEKMKDSQVNFMDMAQQQLFRKYFVVRSWEDFQEKMIDLFNL